MGRLQNSDRVKGLIPRRRPRRWATGVAPGTLLIDPQAPKPQITLIAYGPKELEEKEIKKVSEIEPYVRGFPVVWINVDGLGDGNILRQIENHFKLHPLAMEDVVNVHQRAKVEEYPEYLFIVARMVNVAPELDLEQLSMFLSRRYLLTFQERAGDCFNAVRERLRKSQGPIRTLGPDFLAYSLLDGLIDSYFPILEQYGEKLETFEEACLSGDNLKYLKDLHKAKRELFHVRRTVWPLRDALAELARGGSRFIQEETRLHLRDAYDHTVNLVNLLETYRELSTDLMDLHISMTANRANEVMRVLTIISTLFIPMTFIASIYGMNFVYMPELQWRWGYFGALGLMAAISLGFLIWFARKGWLRSFMPKK